MLKPTDKKFVRRKCWSAKESNLLLLSNATKWHAGSGLGVLAVTLRLYFLCFEQPCWLGAWSFTQSDLSGREDGVLCALSNLTEFLTDPLIRMTKFDLKVVLLFSVEPPIVHAIEDVIAELVEAMVLTSLFVVRFLIGANFLCRPLGIMSCLTCRNIYVCVLSKVV